jgi:hypothetical protein
VNYDGFPKDVYRLSENVASNARRRKPGDGCFNREEIRQNSISSNSRCWTTGGFMLEQIGIVVGIVLGLSSFVYSVLQARRHKKFEKDQFEYQTTQDRLTFLSTVIMDRSLPRSHRQAFYDEYLAKKGNGPVVRLWLLEGKELEDNKGNGK